MKHFIVVYTKRVGLNTKDTKYVTILFFPILTGDILRWCAVTNNPTGDPEITSHLSANIFVKESC